MAIIYIGSGTLVAGQSAYWWWTFGGQGVHRAPFTAQAIPTDGMHYADLRTHDLGVESSLGDILPLYTHHAVVTAKSGTHATEYGLVQGDFL